MPIFVKVLANIATFVRQAPSLFEPYYEDFFITSQDGEQIRDLKLDILCQLATESSIQSILEEFQVGSPGMWWRVEKRRFSDVPVVPPYFVFCN